MKAAAHRPRFATLRERREELLDTSVEDGRFGELLRRSDRCSPSRAPEQRSLRIRHDNDDKPPHAATKVVSRARRPDRQWTMTAGRHEGQSR
jgi:hypothetical protein